MSPRLAISLNILALYAIAGVLGAAFYFQFADGELPCPLCMLQRVAFVALAIGPMLTIVSGPQARNYGLIILAGLIGMLTSGRQVLLHIMPGDPGFGSPVMDLHYYTWAFICFTVGILASGIMLCFERQFEPQISEPEVGFFGKSAIAIVLALTLLNSAGALVQCGFDECPSTPVEYKLLPSLR